MEGKLISVRVSEDEYRYLRAYGISRFIHDAVDLFRSSRDDEVRRLVELFRFLLKLSKVGEEEGK